MSATQYLFFCFFLYTCSSSHGQLISVSRERKICDMTANVGLENS